MTAVRVRVTVTVTVAVAVTGAVTVAVTGAVAMTEAVGVCRKNYARTGKLLGCCPCSRRGAQSFQAPLFLHRIASAKWLITEITTSTYTPKLPLPKECLPARAG